MTSLSSAKPWPALDATDAADVAAGGNPCAPFYQVSPGHPTFAPRARWLGELVGDWYDLGRQIGTRAGELVRWVSDVWWRHHLREWGREDTLHAMSIYEAQIAALSDDLTRFMQGIADGAADELAKSPHAGESSHYQKILNTNIFDSWSWRHPTALPWRSSVRAGRAAAPAAGCSSFVTMGSGPNRRAEVITGHLRHCPFDPKCYQLAYIGRPRGGNAFWVLTCGGAGSGCQIVNDKGVSLILNAGGDQHERLSANAFGVDWFLLFLHVAAEADTAKEAIEIITRGTPRYRARTGRKTLLRTGTWNFLIADLTESAVVEATATRYALRRPGDAGEIGNYLVMTNHNYCTYSVDEDGRRTDIPMTLFGDEQTSPGSATRFWTLMWDIRHHYGQIDRDMAMGFLRGHHQHDRDGRRIESRDGETPLQFTGDVSCPHFSGYPEQWIGGAADAKVMVLGEDAAIYWTLGRPCEWQGPWDTARLPIEGATPRG